MAKKKGKQRRIDMGALPPDPKPIPDTFESVIKALVKPKEQSGKEKPKQ